MIEIKTKPLSVNEVWRGRRFKTSKYKDYENEMFILLPGEVQVTDKLEITFGLSSKLADIDNPVKPFLDILQKKYGFDDREIIKLTLKKEIVPKGKEFIKFLFT